MRRHEDMVEVSCDRHDAPSRFSWRGALWRVLAVENRWVETGPWWTGAQARAARGEHLELDEQDGLLDEIVVWRVEAANGLPGSRGVYELAHSPNRGQWQLRGVMD